MELHIIDVDCGNMILIPFPNGKIVVNDCNITNVNKNRVLGYIDKVIGKHTSIDYFINSHRDADHFRGIKDLHAVHPIKAIRDCGVPGTTPDSAEYTAYMGLRRQLKNDVIEPRRYREFGEALIRYMNGAWDNYTDPNEQSAVLKIEYKGSSVLIGGDTNYRPWKEKILTFYEDEKINSSIFVAPHHGSITFFDDPADTKNHYTEHIKKIRPDMTLISVGINSFGLPDTKAEKLYEKFSRGSDKKNKIYTTQEVGNIRVVLKGSGSWSIYVHQ